MKKLAVLAAAGSLALILSVAAPSFAIAQEEPPPDGQDETVGSDLGVAPASEVDCSQQAAPQEEVTELPTADLDSDENPCTGTGGIPNTGTPQTIPDGDLEVEGEGAPACAQCGMQVAKAAQEATKAAQEAITGDDNGPSPTETFGAALQAARDAGSSATREAAATEETQQSPTPVEDTLAYQAAFEAAKEAGADGETAKETAKQAVADLLPDEAVAETVGSASGESFTGEASKTSEGGSGEGITATQGKTSKDRTSKDDASEDRASKDKPRKEDTTTKNASEEETTTEEVAVSREDGGAGGEDAQTAPAGSRVPLLLGGVALLPVGGYAALRFARSQPLGVRGRRLLRN